MIRDTTKMLAIVGLTLALSASTFAKTQEYSLVIDKEIVNITEKPLKRITINGLIPGPTLEFTNGDEAVIHVTNKMKEDSSVHWHGLLLPGEMDGVPNFNGFPAIKPGETFTYRFKIRQDGTYWYHAHSMAQEQDGHYSSIIIHPKDGHIIKTDWDYVVLISDFHEDEGNTIMANLKKTSEYYVYVRRTLGDFFSSVKKDGFSKAWENAKMWGKMRMLPTDLADISNYTFLVNGKTPDQNWTGLFKLGEKIRLRFINASATSLYDIRIPGLKMTIVAADGQQVEPVTIDEFRFGVAETYDVIVEPQEDKAYTIVAESIDRTGFALATLAPREGMRGEKPKHRPMSLLTMADMGMDHDMSGMDQNTHDMPAMDHSNMDQNQMKQEGHHMGMSMGQGKSMGKGKGMGSMDDSSNSANTTGSPAKDFVTGVPGSGWADANTPAGQKVLSYKDLRYAGIQKDQRMPEREITVRLGGNMERYIWMLNGKKFEESEPISLNYNERVRLTFINDTMMAHPMHLHGMFMQLENGQPMSKMPNKHTIIIAPGDTYSALVTADEAGEWAFHCHLLYHMMAGMMNKVVIAKLDKSQVPVKPNPSQTQKMMDHPVHTAPHHNNQGEHNHAH
ncbi:MAG: copper resistance system multicopper oxidase [Opitutae bacterium]|nr:copper resistance system multicopper oxidase [Opitutae bacterium]